MFTTRSLRVEKERDEKVRERNARNWSCWKSTETSQVGKCEVCFVFLDPAIVVNISRSWLSMWSIDIVNFEKRIFQAWAPCCSHCRVLSVEAMKLKRSQWQYTKVSLDTRFRVSLIFPPWSRYKYLFYCDVQPHQLFLTITFPYLFPALFSFAYFKVLVMRSWTRSLRYKIFIPLFSFNSKQRSSSSCLWRISEY